MKNCHFLDATTQGFPNVHIPIPDIRPVLIGTARRQRKILTSWMIMGIQNGMVIYPLVNSHITMERSTIFHGKIHYFDWVIFNSYVKLPEGNQQQVLVGGWASEKYSSVGSVGWLFAIYGKKNMFFFQTTNNNSELNHPKQKWNFTNNDWDFYHPINWILTNNNWEFKHARNVGMPQNRDSEIRLNHCILGGNPKHPKGWLRENLMPFLESV